MATTFVKRSWKAFIGTAASAATVALLPYVDGPIGLLLQTILSIDPETVGIAPWIAQGLSALIVFGAIWIPRNDTGSKRR